MDAGSGKSENRPECQPTAPKLDTGRRARWRPLELVRSRRSSPAGRSFDLQGRRHRRLGVDSQCVVIHRPEQVEIAGRERPHGWLRAEHHFDLEFGVGRADGTSRCNFPSGPLVECSTILVMAFSFASILPRWTTTVRVQSLSISPFRTADLDASLLIAWLIDRVCLRSETSLSQPARRPCCRARTRVGMPAGAPNAGWQAALRAAWGKGGRVPTVGGSASEEIVVVRNTLPIGYLAFGRRERVGRRRSRMSLVGIGVGDGQEIVAAATTPDFLPKKVRRNAPPRTAMRARKYHRHARFSARAKWGTGSACDWRSSPSGGGRSPGNYRQLGSEKCTLQS